MPTTPTSVRSSSRFPPSTSSTPRSNAARCQIDAAQAERIVRSAGSTLAFASYDPGTASGDRLFAFRKMSLNEELYRPKRIVVEISPGGKSSWRFVPKARMEDGVENEGSWPQMVDLCGEYVTMSQDQWDAFKLDPDFDCLIRRAPHLPLITRSLTKKDPLGELSDPYTFAEAGPSRPLKPVNIRRRVITTTKIHSNSRSPVVPKDIESESESDLYVEGASDEEKVERMVGDNWKPSLRVVSERLKAVRKKHKEARQFRKEQNARRRTDAKMEDSTGSTNKENEDTEIPHLVDEDVIMHDLEWESFPLRPSTNNATRRAQTVDPRFDKRKADDLSDSEGNSDVEVFKRSKTYEPKDKTKRVRTLSPKRCKKELQKIREARIKKRLEELQRRRRNRMDADEAALLRELTGQRPDAKYYPDGEMEDVSASEAAIEESIRKLAELEADRPLWEEYARRRAAKEDQEKRTTESKKREAQRKSAEQAESAAREDEAKKNTQQEAQRKAAEDIKKEKERRAEEERRKLAEAKFELRSRREKARRLALEEINSSRHTYWTASRALERYRTLCARFDSAKFPSEESHAVFENIPWPMLSRPGTYGVEDIGWDSVEEFFKAARQLLPSNEFKELVGTSRKRFHPDRWRARKVLNDVDEDEERECLMIAVSTVSQALSPLWEEVSGR